MSLVRKIALVLFYLKVQKQQLIRESLLPEEVSDGGPYPLRLAAIEFEADLNFHELPAFRAAVAEKAGLQHHLFHNHLPDGSLRQLYPLIQYKIFRGKPMLFCVQEGIDAVQHFFIRPDWTLFIGNRELKLKLGEMSIRQFKLQVWDSPMTYRMRNWIPLGSENYSRYKSMGLKDRVELLESTLTGNVLSMAKGIGWHIHKKVETSILDLGPVKWVPYKGIQHMAFDVQFSCNAFLPRHIGLGRKVAVGFGTVLPDRKPENDSKSERK